MSDTRIIELYERHALSFDRDRDRSLQEKPWLDRFLEHVPKAGTILDIGCGMGEPIARYCIEAGFKVVGIDASPSLIALCRTRFPQATWLVADMRDSELHRRFDGLIAWDSFFHLSAPDQRKMFPSFNRHAKPGAPLLFTSGTSEGERTGCYNGEPLYHASLDPSEYRHLLSINGFSVLSHVAEDPECSGHTVWLALQGKGRVR
jgi:2-polyprenyl-3-methyl-5-hydroxy-6-metoxy-1,4-benzoquinol methylase